MPRRATQSKQSPKSPPERDKTQALKKVEVLLEEKTRDLARLSREFSQLAKELEDRVEERTSELNHEIEMRRETEENLEDARVFLDTVIENLPSMLCIKDAKDLRFILFNRAGEELIGYDRSAFVGKNDYDFFPKDQADHFAARDREVLNSLKAQVTLEEPIATRHKGMRLLRTTKVPVLNKRGKPKYLLALSEDITERHAIEQQLRQAVKMEAVGQLTGRVAHDFNNLLSLIIGSLDLVLECEPEDATVKELVQGALDGALRGAELVQRLLAFSRKQALRPTVIDLNGRLPQVASMLRRTLGEQISVAVKPGAGLWATTADAAQIDEAILNLAINARDAMPGGGRLTIETANVELDKDYASLHVDVAPGDYVLLAVSDSGTGMPPDVVERAFEPFFTTRADNKGTGLGLSMVYGFVKQSGGHIKIYSEVGHGTTIKIYLPRANGVHAAQGPSEAAESGSARNELILVVEDNDGVRGITLRQLADLGYRTLEATDAKAALAILDKHTKIDMLFTDIVMPGGMTGAELAREVARLRPGIRILLTSGFTQHAATNGYHDIEGLELLNKPFRKKDLGVKLRQIFEAGQ